MQLSTVQEKFLAQHQEILDDHTETKNDGIIKQP